MKKIELNNISNLESLQGGTNEWYWCANNTDLYEAQQLFEYKNKIDGNCLYFVHYPDGKVYHIEKTKHCYMGRPIYNDGFIAFLMVDFAKQKIHIFHFDTVLHDTKELVQLPLSIVKDCYNLLLHTSPLTLTRQCDGYFEMIWPEKVRFSISKKENFCFREKNKLYFNIWHEDPEYREETIIRMLPEGNITEKFSGYVCIMPNGEKWNLK